MARNSSLRHSTLALIMVALCAPLLHSQDTQSLPTQDIKSPHQPPSPGSETPLDTRYRISHSDVLELHFPYLPDFNQAVTVQPDGYISLKGIDDVRAMGRTVAELQAEVAEAYRTILRDPVLGIVLKDAARPYFMVAGEVAHPGKFELRGATTLTQALALAGGHTSAARHSQVVLFRQVMSEWLEVKEVNVKKMYASRDLSEDPLLRPGDTILVPKSTLAKLAPIIARASLGFYLNPFQQ